MINPPDTKTLRRFMSKTATVGDCLVWLGYVGKTGVPEFDYGKAVSARRLMCNWLYGEPAEQRLRATQTCETALCVRHVRWLKGRGRISLKEKANENKEALCLSNYAI